MKRFIYAAIAVTIILTGCEYHPFYDGQAFGVYAPNVGLIRTDGTTINVPIVDRSPYVLEFYGGMGKNHNIIVADPDCLDYVYEESDVVSSVGDTDIVPASITLQPKKKADTSITIEDIDTGESITINVSIKDSYKAAEVMTGNDTFRTRTLFVFDYFGSDDIVKICRHASQLGHIEHIVDGRYEFVVEPDELYGDVLYFEITYPADETGKPSAAGVETFKRYLVGYEGGGYGSADWQMELLNLIGFRMTTKMSDPSYEYNAVLRFVDVTGMEDYVIDENFDGDHFMLRSAQLFLWDF